MVNAPHGPGISDTRIVFYDGYCVLCSRSVDFIISRDPTGRSGSRHCNQTPQQDSYLR